MKKNLIRLAVFAAIGIATYFTYEHYFGCKENCETSCENKDSVSVSTPAMPTVAVNDSCIAKDTIKK